jgi:hypothetical protein
MVRATRDCDIVSQLVRRIGMRRFVRGVFGGFLGSLIPALAGAQGAVHVPVAGFLPQMVATGAVIAPGSQGDQSGLFVAAASSNPALAALNRTLALQVGSFPLGPTGTTVLFGGDSGTDDKTRFASGYTDGAATLGRGRRSLAVTYQDTTYDSIDGLDLRGSSVNLFVQNACCTGTAANRDLLQETVSLRLHRRVTAFVLGYGVSDRFDIGIVVPYVQIAADARVESTIIRTATAADPTINEFGPIGAADQTIPAGFEPPAAGIAGTGSTEAKGIGDIVLRGKFRLLRSGNQQLAVGLDLLAPTGNADEFIGIGATQVTPAVMWSMSSQHIGARARVDYTQSFGNLSSLLASPGVDLKVPNEVGYAFGLDLPVAPRTTFVADVTGRRIPGVAGFTTTDSVFNSSGPGPLPSANFVAVNNLQATPPRTINSVLASTGARVYLGGPIYADLRVLFPLGSSGLQPRPTGVFTLDYAF